MPTVPEEVVEATWRQVASLDPRGARRLMVETAERQPALLAYVMASTADSRSPVQELAIYLYYVVLQMFDLTGSNRVKEVTVSIIEHHSAENESLLERLLPAHERFLERVAGVQSSSQPFVFRYIAEALLEEAESDPSSPLAEEETGLLFLTLKTVVDALDEASSV